MVVNPTMCVYTLCVFSSSSSFFSSSSVAESSKLEHNLYLLSNGVEYFTQFLPVGVGHSVFVVLRLEFLYSFGF